MYGDCTSYNGQIRLHERMLDYRGVGLVRFHCICLWPWVILMVRGRIIIILIQSKFSMNYVCMHIIYCS